MLCRSSRALTAYLQRAAIGANAPYALARLRRPPRPVAHVPAALGAALASDVLAGRAPTALLSRIAQDLPPPSLHALIDAIGGANVTRAAAVLQLRRDALRAPDAAPVASATAQWLTRVLSHTPLRVERVHESTSHTLLCTLTEASRARSPQPVDDVAALRHRAKRDDARIFVAFHNVTGDIPLAFTELVLRDEAPECTRALVEMPETEKRVAVFYSLVAVEPVGVAAALIKAVVERRAEAEARRFLTLSPIPGFREWLAGTHRREGGEEEMREAAVHYLLRVKNEEGAPICNVCAFHLRNGASLSHVVLNADPSRRRLLQSFGVMAVYEYPAPTRTI